MELPSRLMRICLSLVWIGVDGFSGNLPLNCRLNSSFLAFVRTRIREAISATIAHGEQGILSTVILPASIFEISRMSLIICRQVVAVLVDGGYGLPSFPISVCRWILQVFPHRPSMAVIGVLISWLILARNSLLERLAVLGGFLGSLQFSVGVGGHYHLAGCYSQGFQLGVFFRGYRIFAVNHKCFRAARWPVGRS